MGDSTFIKRVVLRNYKSIAACDVPLGPLNFLVGPNGAGKSNFLGALQLVADALRTTWEQAMRERGGRVSITRRGALTPGGRAGVRLDFELEGHLSGHYALEFSSQVISEDDVDEECVIKTARGEQVSYTVRGGQVRSSEKNHPAPAGGRLFLVAMSGFDYFRQLYDALSHMVFYNLNPALMAGIVASSSPADSLTRDGSNLTGVFGRLSREAPAIESRIEQYLSKIVPDLQDVDILPLEGLGYEVLRFKQQAGSGGVTSYFLAPAMSDGTLRALGLLVAVLQTTRAGNPIRLLGIEEPETGLHPFAASTVLGALREASKGVQIIATSHSPELLDDKEVSDTEILTVASEQGETRIGPIDAADRSVIKDRLYTAGELLRINQLHLAEDAPRPRPDELRLFDNP